LYVDDFKGNDPLYLYYLLKTIPLASYGGGSAVPTLNRNHIHPIEIKHTPSLPEQRRIAGILGAIDDKIENNRRINTNLELQAQALFDEWLCKDNTIKGTFNDIIDATLAGDWGQETTQGNYTHEVFCIRGADIPALQNGDKGKMPIRYILEKNYKTKQLCANDLVIEISGGSPTQSTGRICMITQSLLDRLGKDVVCTNFCRAITPKNGYAIYIYLYWQMLYNKNTMFSYENGTTGIKNLNIADLISKEPIEIPAQKDVEKLNVVLQPIFDKIYANGLQNETLANLRDTLLPKLMNGEIKL
jgi:type I restriction enzyme S subunit